MSRAHALTDIKPPRAPLPYQRHFSIRHRSADAVATISSIRRYSLNVCFTPDSGRTADIPDWQLRAITRREQMQQTNVRQCFYSMTSSARPSTDAGTLRPSALAALRLITSSNLVGCSTANSPGFAPLRILSTYIASRWNTVLRSGP